MNLIQGLQLYLNRQATSVWRYCFEQAIVSALGWIPTVIGVAVRAVLYKLLLRMDSYAAIENNVRLRFCDNITLGKGVYLDQGVYLHACPNGIQLGANTLVM